MYSYTVTSLSELDQFAQKLVHFVTANASTQNATVVTLVGDLGAGKTTLVQMIARHFRIDSPVVSPTFVIQKTYSLSENPVFSCLIHIDAYRFTEQSESHILDFPRSYADPSKLIFVEWPNHMDSVLPKNSLEITITHGVGDTRILTINFDI